MTGLDSGLAALALRRVEPHGIDMCATQFEPYVKNAALDLCRVTVVDHDALRDRNGAIILMVLRHHFAHPTRTWITSESGCSTACGI